MGWKHLMIFAHTNHLLIDAISQRRKNNILNIFQQP